MSCCPHPDSDHIAIEACQEVIHYPSEDYPCLCTGYVPGEGEICQVCEHRHTSHKVTRVCRPESGELCACHDAL